MFRRVCSTSSLVTVWLIVNFCWPSLIHSWSVISERSASGQGKNLLASRQAFSLWEKASTSESTSFLSGGRTKGSGLVWLCVLAHFSRAQIFRLSFDALAIALRQLLAFACCISRDWSLYALVRSSHVWSEGCDWYLWRAALELAAALPIFWFHQCSRTPVYALRFGVDMLAIRVSCSSRLVTAWSSFSLLVIASGWLRWQASTCTSC